MTGRDADLELVRELESGDADTRRRALGHLYERHRRRVFNVAWRVLGDWDEAQDVTHDVFLQMADRASTFRGDAGFTSWIYRVTLNRAIDSKRRQRRRPAWLMGESVPEGDLRRPRGERPQTDPAGDLERASGADAVQEALARLSPKLRAVAVLRYMEGLSYEQLAEVLGCSLGTVKSRLNRAHAALEQALGRSPGPPA